MRIALLVYPDCVASTALGMFDILTHAQRLAPSGPADSARFSVELVAVGPEPVVTVGASRITCRTLLETCADADLILVPPLAGAPDAVLARHPALPGWLRAQHRRGATLSSSCTGVFWLAAAGLLDGREATTSWFSAEAFRARFPHVRLRADRLLVDGGSVITGGGTLAFANLCVYLIEKYLGKRLANQSANVFLVDKGKCSQLPYHRFAAPYAHDDPQIGQAQAYIEDRADAKLTVQEVASASAMSERSFIRRFKAATGHTPSEYIQLVKVEQAKGLLEEGSRSVKEISFGTGYDDLPYFRTLFKRHTGLTPVAYRRLFSF